MVHAEIRRPAPPIVFQKWPEVLGWTWLSSRRFVGQLSPGEGHILVVLDPTLKHAIGRRWSAATSSARLSTVFAELWTELGQHMAQMWACQDGTPLLRSSTEQVCRHCGLSLGYHQLTWLPEVDTPR